MKAVININEGSIELNLEGNRDDQVIWRAPRPLENGKPFSMAWFHFFKDLARMGSWQSLDLGGIARKLDKALVDELYNLMKKPPNIAGIKLWDEAEPSNDKPRMNNVVGNGAGTSKTSSSKDKGKGKMFDISEIDPGDNPNANPGDFSSF